MVDRPTAVVLMSINYCYRYTFKVKYFEVVMYSQKYFTLNFFINEILSVEKFLNYGIYVITLYVATHVHRHTSVDLYEYVPHIAKHTAVP